MFDTSFRDYVVNKFDSRFSGLTIGSGHLAADATSPA